MKRTELQKTSKICNLCKVDLPLDKFTFSCNRYKSACKECINAYYRKKRRDNPVKLEGEKLLKSRERSKRFYHKNKHRLKRTKEKAREYHETNYARNSEKIRARRKEYYAKNKERETKRNAEYAKNNKGRCNAIKLKYHAKKLKATPSWADSEKIRIVYEKAEWLSNLMGKVFHVDHVIPLQGENVCGLHVWENLQILEYSINCSKKNKEDFSYKE